MKPFVIAQISDLHLDGGGARLSATKPLLAALNSRMKEFRDATVKILLITGDLIETPHKKPMQEATDFLAAVKNAAIFTEVVILAGNHDVKYKGLAGWSDEFYERFDAPRVTRMVRKDGLDLVLLDSNHGLLAKGGVPASSYDEMVATVAEMSEALRGEVKATQNHVAREDDGAPLRVLALHHHPLPLPEGEGKKVYGVPDEPFMYMVSSGTFLDAAMSLDVSLILHGHRHVTGITRYSTPNRAHVAGGNEDVWKTIYVLSCPSSTGADCDAGFNIISLDRFDRFERAGYKLSIDRYTRPHNAGAFEPLDRAGKFQFLVGEELYRDIALQIQDEVLDAKQLNRQQVMDYARRSLARKAFLSKEERAWAYAMYAYIVTYKLWGRPLQHLFVNQALRIDQEAVLTIVNQLAALVDLAAKVLGLNGAELDDFRERALRVTQRDFVASLPPEPARNVDMEEVQLARREILKSIDYAAKVLCGMSLGLGSE